MLIISLLYKAKIIVTNLVLKFGLKFTVGETVGGVSFLYEALPVECFWNSVVIKRVVHEARLRMFGFALAHRIANDALNDKLPEKIIAIGQNGLPEGNWQCGSNDAKLSSQYDRTIVEVSTGIEDLGRK